MRDYMVASWREHFMLKVNPVIRFMIYSDFLWVGSLGLLSPIFALLVEDSIVGGNAAVVGIASAIYLITKSVVQMVAASYVDRIKGELDDFWVLFPASVVSVLFPLLYLFMETPLHLFVIQFFYGVLAALTFPTFTAIFTRHIDKNKEGTEWALYYSISDLGSAFAAFAGGLIATLAGFDFLILFAVGTGLVGVSLLLLIKPYLFKR
jgi:sugar phosphate permease